MVAVSLKKLTVSLLPLFPLSSSFRLMQPDVGAQDPDATFDDDCYYHEGAYYYVKTADDQE